MRDVVLAHQFENIRQQRESAAWGMWIFLATEVLFFGGLFTVYTVYRFLHPADFSQASTHLYLWLGALNTAVLLTSSWTMAHAVRAVSDNKAGPARRFLAATVVLGILFLAVKAGEYWLDYRDGIIPGAGFDAEAFTDPRAAQLFFVIYFIMTGLHALHMLIGISVIFVLIAWLYRAPAVRRFAHHVEVTGLYWHFVDIVWIFLFPLLYLA